MEINTTRSSPSGPARHYDPLNNFLFFKVMGEKGSEVQLLGFINAVLGKSGEDRYTSVEIIENKAFAPDAPGGKSCILDVRAVLRGSARVNVEVQLKNQHNIDRRSLFYWSKEYTEALAAGRDYAELPDVVAINIVNFNFPETRGFHSVFHLREDIERDVVLTGALEIHYLNMVRYRRQGGKTLDDPLRRWLAWLDRGSPPDLVAEVVRMDEAIQTADERMALVTSDKEEMRAYWRYQMALSDRTSELNYAKNEGRSEERQRIKELFDQGLSVEEIKKYL